MKNKMCFKKSNKLIYRIMAGALSFAMIFGTIGCGKSGTGIGDGASDLSISGNFNSSETEGIINIYYISPEGTVVSDERYQLKQPDSISASLDEIMAIQTFPEGLVYNSFVLDESNIVTLYVTNEDGTKITKEKELLAKASVVKTLGQIDGLRGIMFVDDGRAEQDVNVYTENSFFFYDNDKLNENGNVDIYIPTENGAALKRLVVSVNVTATTSLELAIINELKTRNVIPEQAIVREAYIKDGICYVNANKDFFEQKQVIAGQKIYPEVTIYAIVNSLTSLENVDGVQFLCEGEKLDNYMNAVDISSILQYKGGLLN